jgi:hypothetical protein
MSTVTWVCQGLLAAIFLASGSAKSSMSRYTLLATGQTGIAAFSPIGRRAGQVGDP